MGLIQTPMQLAFIFKFMEINVKGSERYDGACTDSLAWYSEIIRWLNKMLSL